jgi:hypothetical protein
MITDKMTKTKWLWIKLLDTNWHDKMTVVSMTVDKMTPGKMIAANVT